jgi:hypothetical protein
MANAPLLDGWADYADDLTSSQELFLENRIYFLKKGIEGAGPSSVYPENPD